MAVVSALGEGTTFTLRLPATSKRPAAALRRVEPPIGLPQGGTVLAIDSDPAVAETLRLMLEGDGYKVLHARDLQQGLQMARTLRPAAITLDMLRPEKEGWTALTALKAAPETADVPVLMLTLVDDQQLVFALGVADSVGHKAMPQEMLKAVRKQNANREQSILIVEDEASAREVLRDTLIRDGWKVREACDGKAGLMEVTLDPPQLILLDLMMPGMDGFEFAARLRATEQWRSIPIVVVTARDLDEAEWEQLAGSVEKILQKGSYSREDLLREVRGLTRAKGG